MTVLNDNGAFLTGYSYDEFGVTEQRLNVSPTEGAEDYAQIVLGLDCSVGIAQVRISTAKRLENAGYLPKTKSKKIGRRTVGRNRRIYNKLVKTKHGVNYAAAELKYQIKRWKTSYPKISKDVAILATVYNRGNDISPRSNPSANKFGKFAKKNYKHVKKLIK